MYAAGRTDAGCVAAAAAPGGSLGQEEPRKKRKQRLIGGLNNCFSFLLIQDEVGSLDSIWRAEMDEKVTLCLARVKALESRSALRILHSRFPPNFRPHSQPPPRRPDETASCSCPFARRPRVRPAERLLIVLF
jgi:hypothetical protein